MGSEADKPANGGAHGRKKDAIHFVNARPASESERLNIKRLVRAHVGKWISTQTKGRAAGSSVVVDSSPLIASTEKPDPQSHMHAFEVDSDDPYLASSTLSPASSASSRTSPESCISNTSQTASPPPPRTAPPLSQPDLSLAIIHPQTIVTPTTNADTQSYGQEDSGSSHSDTPSPPHSGEYIEAIGAGRLDPFRVYSSQFEPEIVQMSEEYCLSCLWPGLTPGLSGTNMSSWFPMSLSDPTLFTAFLYGSLSHMRLQALNGWIPRHMFRVRQQRLLEYVEMETIKMVSQEMDNPSRAVCDAMIFSVVCMAHNKADENLSGFQGTPFTSPMQRLQWLDVYGSLPPNLVHVGGLVQMVNLRGGIDKIQLPGLASIISFSDLVTSSTFLSHPVFPWVPLDESRKTRTMQQILGYTDASIDYFYAHFQYLGLPRIFAEILCAMNTYTDLVDQCLEGHIGYDPCLLADQRNVVHYTLLCLPPAQATQRDHLTPTFSYTPQSIIYEALRLACLVYSVGVILPLPAQSTPLTKLADLLRNTLQISNHASVWAFSPHAQVALLWILTLGGIAAQNTPHRPWYADILSRVAEHNKVTSYDDLKRYLSLLAWYPKACEKPGLELWVDAEKSRGIHP